MTHERLLDKCMPAGTSCRGITETGCRRAAEIACQEAAGTCREYLLSEYPLRSPAVVEPLRSAAGKAQRPAVAEPLGSVVGE